MEGGILYWPLYVPYKLYIPSASRLMVVMEKLTLYTGSGRTRTTTASQTHSLHLIYSKLGYKFGSSDYGSSLVKKIRHWWWDTQSASWRFQRQFCTGCRNTIAGAWHTRHCWQCRYKEVGHNPLDRLIFLWIIPNGVWLVIPAIVIKRFGSEMMERLNTRGLKQQ